MAADPIVTDPVDTTDAVTAAVRRFCGWHIAPEVTEVLTLDGTGGQFLPLPSLHITDVSQVVEDGTVLDADSYQWSAMGMLWRAYRWTGNYRAVAVSLTHGYPLEDVDDVAGVLAAKAARMSANPRGATRVQAGPFAEQYEQSSGFTADEELVLGRYRIPGRP